MRVSLLQLNPTVGNLESNALQIIAEYSKAVARGAELVVSTELALCGYPPRDLLLKDRFIADCFFWVDQIAEKIGEVPLILGSVAKAGKGVGPLLTNAAFVLQSGQIIGRQDKTLLPNYDVFDEQRYFRPATSSEVFLLNGCAVGITICEDVWSEEYLPAPLYSRCPPVDLVAKGAEILVNLSASPFALGKPERRGGMLSLLAEKLKTPLVYCNAVGGNDQLIFDGHSCAFNQHGECLAQAKGFAEQTLLVDMAAPAIVTKKKDEYEELYSALVLGVQDYVKKCGFSKVVLGLSGGIDSALTAVLAVDALGADCVHGLLMPSAVSSDHSLADAHQLCQNLGISSDVIAIEDLMSQAESTLAEVFVGLDPDVTEENLQARLRGMLLMAYSNKKGHLLLTTGNKSELAVGYCTIYGDMCGGLAVIADVPKTKVFGLSSWINRDKERIPWNSIQKPPSAELRLDQKDQDSLPEYEILDQILALYVEENCSVAQIVEQEIASEEIVRWVARRVDLNEWKRQQAAPGLRVTSRAFGVGRRLPIAQGYVGK